MPKRLKADVALRWHGLGVGAAGRRRRRRRGAARGPRGRRDDRARPLGGARRRHGGHRRGRAAARRQPARLGRLRRRAPRGAGAVARRTFAPGPLGHRLQRRSARAARSAWAPTRRDRRSFPYGVDADGFPRRRRGAGPRRGRCSASPPDVPLVVAIGRFVKKKGFEYLIDAVPALVARHPSVQVVLAGGGDLEAELRSRACGGRRGRSRPLPGPGRTTSRCRWCWPRPTSRSCPRIRDDAGNVDGLPNVVLEALASGTPVVATPAGGIAVGRSPMARTACWCPSGTPPASPRPSIGCSPTRPWAPRWAAGRAAACRRSMAGPASRWPSKRPTPRPARAPCRASGRRSNMAQASSSRAMTTPPGLSVFFPAYNDGGTIASMVITAAQTARDADRRLRGHRRQRRQRRRAPPRSSTSWRASIRSVRVVHHAQQPRLRRRAADRLPIGDARS